MAKLQHIVLFFGRQLFILYYAFVYLIKNLWGKKNKKKPLHSLTIICMVLLKQHSKNKNKNKTKKGPNRQSLRSAPGSLHLYCGAQCGKKYI